MKRHYHGESHTLLYGRWKAMRKRCANKNDTHYHMYGGRGIFVCERWAVFANFKADMGEAPLGCSIDRIDTNGPYSPESCRWATYREQANNVRDNRFLTWKGETHTMAEWARKLNLNYHFMRDRLRIGWSVEETFGTPKLNSKRCKNNESLWDNQSNCWNKRDIFEGQP